MKFYQLIDVLGSGGMQYLDQVEIMLRSRRDDSRLRIYIDVFDNSLAQKWITALSTLLRDNYHLEKNYCWMGFLGHDRDGKHILDAVNNSIQAINQANLGYKIQDQFSMADVITDEPEPDYPHGRNIRQHRMNQLHRYFEDLQGVSGAMSQYWQKADAVTRWHIRQLNLLCHEFESWALAHRKQIEAPEWQRPSTLFCWLNAPRFTLDDADFDCFGIDTLSRGCGDVYVGVNKAVGKHHWEVFCDEGRDSRIGELVSSTLRGQTEASGDFDIEWGRDPAAFEWQQRRLQEFRDWLVLNGFDPQDKTLTIGHPRIGKVDLKKSFGTENCQDIWQSLNKHLDVESVATSYVSRRYDYHWSDMNYQAQQIKALGERT